MNTSTKRFITNVSQISIEQSRSDQIHGNNKDEANQQLTDEFTEKVEKIVDAKDKDIMTI